MAHETVNYHDRIVLDPADSTGKPVVRGTRVLAERVLRYLADHPNPAETLAAFPELSLADVQAVLDYAHARIAEPPQLQSPQDFYREAVQRDDIRRILTALAK